MAKKSSLKYIALVRYAVEVEVPLKEQTLENAAAEANSLKIGDVFSGNYEVIDYPEDLQVRGILAQ